MSRLNIPDPVKLKLWALSGGRCEFPGCNEYVWRDGLTLQEDNFAHMAHIVAASPNGPRGSEDLSSELVMDFENLMLVCLSHSKLIDGKNCEEYSIEYLRDHKQAHEDRIRRQTAVQPDASTTILRFMANIGDRSVKIPLGQAQQAILPLFPHDDRGILLDYTARPGHGEANFWESFADEIAKRIEREFAGGNDRGTPEHISVFALGPIPLLIKLGNAMGNTISAELYQRHRDTEDWKWKPENEDVFQYRFREAEGADNKNVAVVLSLSGKVHEDEVYKSFDSKPFLYEIFIDSPSPAFLNQRSRLELFRNKYRELLSSIRHRHGPDVVIHLFPAIPAPVAVICGRDLLPKADPSMVVYDHENAQGGFVQTLTVN